MTLAIGFGPQALAEAPTQLNQWAGETLQPDEGAIFVYFEARESKEKDSDQKIENEVTVSVINLITKKPYTFAQGLGKFPTPLVWRLPAGKYAVRSLKALGSDGKVYTAKFQKKEGKRFLVKKQYISHLSTWIVFTVSGETLKIGIKKKKNAYHPTDAATLKNFKGILNGLNGNVELDFENLDKEPDLSDDVMKKKVKTKKTIAMFFRLNMFKNNKQAPQIATAIASTDTKLRECYTHALEKSSDLKGEVLLRFAISKETHSFKKIAVSTSAIDDEEFKECLLLNLKALTLPANKSMLGELVLSFDFS